LLTSDEDSDEEKSNKDENESDDASKKKSEDMPKESEPKPEKTKEKKKENKKTKMQKFYDAINQGPGTGHASDFSSDSDDSEIEKPSKKKKKTDKSAHNSRSGTPVDATSSAVNKRKADIAMNSDNSNSPQSTPAKKLKTESSSTTPFTSYSSSKDNFGSTEVSVRRYLMRKPMTTTELLKKIQSKKTGVSSDELVELMTAVLKKINPSKQRTQGKMYLSLKPT
jgi:transcription initiation factor TFIIF subunit alpha